MILGLDVSTTRIGWAIIDEAELVDSDFFKIEQKDESRRKSSRFCRQSVGAS